MDNDYRLFKIGFVGGKPYDIGGHDPEDPQRKRIYDTLRQTVKALVDEHPNIVAYSCGDIGSEHDFLEICQELKIDYIIIAPHEGFSKKWNKFGFALETYNKFLDNAFEVISIKSGAYSATKSLSAYQELNDRVDVLVVNSGRFNSYKYDLANKSKYIFI